MVSLGENDNRTEDLKHPLDAIYSSCDPAARAHDASNEVDTVGQMFPLGDLEALAHALESELNQRNVASALSAAICLAGRR